MTASAILDDLTRRGGTARVLPTGKLRIEPATVVDDALLVELKEQRAEIIAELRRRDPAALIEEARSAGLALSVAGDDLRVRHLTGPAPDTALLQRLADNKLAVIAELRRESDVIQYAAERGLYEAEWRVAGCAAFTALERAAEAAEARYGGVPGLRRFLADAWLSHTG